MHPQANLQKTLEITLWNKGLKNDFMGRTSMKLDQVLPPATCKEGWFELYDGDRGKHEFKVMELVGDASKHYVALFDYNPRCKQELLLRQVGIASCGRNGGGTGTASRCRFGVSAPSWPTRPTFELCSGVCFAPGW
jgi:hypothetical protein